MATTNANSARNLYDQLTLFRVQIALTSFSGIRAIYRSNYTIKWRLATFTLVRVLFQIHCIPETVCQYTCSMYTSFASKKREVNQH